MILFPDIKKTPREARCESLIELKKMTNQKLDTYLNLCTQVYDLSKPTPPEDSYAFYRSYVANTKGRILEPMCGTGRYLLPLLEEGFDVHGFDASEHMLEALTVKARQRKLSPTVWPAFVEELNQAAKYSLIFIPCGSFGLITDLQAATSALKILYDHLEPDGMLLLEVETLKSVPQCGIWRGGKWTREDGKMIVDSHMATLEGDVCHSVGKYELIDGNKIIQTEIELYKIRLYDDPSVMTEMLKAVGYKDIRIVKAFDASMLADVNDEVVVYECRK